MANEAKKVLEDSTQYLREAALSVLGREAELNQDDRRELSDNEIDYPIA